MSVVIETTLGDITVDLYLEQRPVTCLNFLKLCKMKYYNYNLFHTIRSGFIAQTGDPSGEGSGGESIFGLLKGPDKRFFSGEKMPKIRHSDTGLLSMVCTGEMMVGSQFFLTLGPDLDSLDGIHCVIGEVTEGHDVLRKLNDAICDEKYRPYQDVRVTHTVILEDPFNDPSGFRAPSRSPSPSIERLKNGRLAPDEEIDETQGKTAAEIQELIEEKEAKARATILEIVGDIPDADIAPPENVLFVCKLNPVTTDEDLEIIFSRFGKIVSCEVIRDKKTGDSLQYAFIEFDDKKPCEEAYFKMDNVLIDDRRIHVDFSQSVSKIKWLGKGRGVKHINENDESHNDFNHSIDRGERRREKRSRSRDRPRQDKRDHRDKMADRDYTDNSRDRYHDRHRNHDKERHIDKDKIQDRHRNQDRDRHHYKDRYQDRDKQKNKEKNQDREKYQAREKQEVRDKHENREKHHYREKHDREKQQDRKKHDREKHYDRDGQQDKNQDKPKQEVNKYQNRDKYQDNVKHQNKDNHQDIVKHRDRETKEGVRHQSKDKYQEKERNHYKAQKESQRELKAHRDCNERSRSPLQIENSKDKDRYYKDDKVDHQDKIQGQLDNDDKTCKNPRSDSDKRKKLSLPETQTSKSLHSPSRNKFGVQSFIKDKDDSPYNNISQETKINTSPVEIANIKKKHRNEKPHTDGNLTKSHKSKNHKNTGEENNKPNTSENLTTKEKKVSKRKTRIDSQTPPVKDKNSKITNKDENSKVEKTLKKSKMQKNVIKTKKIRKHSTSSSDSDTSDTSTTTSDTSTTSSSESDQKKRKVRRKRKYSTSSSSSSSSDSSSTTSSSDSSSSTSSSSDSEPQKKKKKISKPGNKMEQKPKKLTKMVKKTK